MLDLSTNAGDRQPCPRPPGAPAHRQLTVAVLLPPGASHHRHALASLLTAALPSEVPTALCHNHFRPQHDLSAAERLLLIEPAGPSCAGGPIGMLDLESTQAAASALARVLHHRWRIAVAGTPAARPWRHYLRRHRGAPRAYPMHQATDEFAAQPRITAMIEYSRRTDPADEFRLDEYDAGLIAHQEAAFGDYLCGIALFADGLSTADGQVLSPDPGDEGGRSGFHNAAHNVLHAADPGSVIVAAHLYL